VDLKRVSESLQSANISPWALWIFVSFRQNHQGMGNKNPKEMYGMLGE